MDQPANHRSFLSRHAGTIIANCLVAEALVAAALDVSRDHLHAPNRCRARIARARQIAIYIAHGWLDIPVGQVVRHFRRDRSTISHACRVIEDRREDPRFDRMLTAIEIAVDLWLDNLCRYGDRA